MKTLILAGGRGTRMGRETEDLPKPLITIGGIPIIHHIMNYYAIFGYKDFIILGGYKVDKLRQYFTEAKTEGLSISILDTGLDTPTGQRVLEAEKFIDEKKFMLTYGDGLGDIDLARLETSIFRGVGIVTAVHPPGRFGTLSFIGETNYISRFDEKQRLESEWINGGFMCFTKEIFKYIEPNEMLEFDILPRLAEERLLQAHLHTGHWRCMDTVRDREELEKIWSLKRCWWR